VEYHGSALGTIVKRVISASKPESRDPSANIEASLESLDNYSNMVTIFLWNPELGRQRSCGSKLDTSFIGGNLKSSALELETMNGLSPIYL
jgi:hypothetical protein